MTLRPAKVPWPRLWFDLLLISLAVIILGAALVFDASFGCSGQFGRSGAVAVALGAWLGYRSLTKHYSKFALNTERGYSLTTSLNQRIVDAAALLIAIGGTLIWAYGDKVIKGICA
jgi:hypothetical protein